MRRPDSAAHLPRTLALLAPAALLIMAGACGPEDEAPASDASDAPETAGEAAAATTAGSEAFVDGPDLWLAELEYDASGVPRLGSGRNITSRAGYDNQPKFLPDGSILYTRGVGDRTDIWRYDPATDSHSPVTETPNQSEYSATPTPDGTGFSAIVVEPDSMQRLWRFDLDGSNGAPIFEDIAPVGYHAWMRGGRIGMFVLGSPATLQTAVAGAAGPGEVMDEGIGRSLNTIPGSGGIISYPVATDSVWEVWVLGDQHAVPVGHEGPLLDIELFARIPSQDHAWTPTREILFGVGHRLMSVGMAPRSGSELTGGPETPEPLFDQPPVRIGALPDTTMVISRLAVSDDGTSIVLVVDRPQN